MGYRNFDRAQAEFERRREMSPEDEDEQAEKLRARREYQEEHADELRERQEDDRANREQFDEGE